MREDAAQAARLRQSIETEGLLLSTLDFKTRWPYLARRR
jgi:hypothetical protein